MTLNKSFCATADTSTHTWNLARPVIKYCLRIQLRGQRCISLSDKQKLRWIVANSNDVYINTHIYGFDCFSFSGQNDLHMHFVCPCFSLVNYCDLPRTFELVHPTPSTTAIANALGTMTFHSKRGTFWIFGGSYLLDIKDTSSGEVTNSGWPKARFPPLACTKCQRSTPPRFWPAKFLFQPGLQDEESVLFKRVSRSYDMCCVTLAARMEKRNGHENAAYLLKGKCGLAVNGVQVIANGRMTLYSELGKIQHRTLRAHKYLGFTDFANCWCEEELLENELNACSEEQL